MTNNTCYSDYPLERRMEYAREITGELSDEMEKLFVLACAAEDIVHNKDGEPEVIKLLQVIQERACEVSPQLARLGSCFPEKANKKKLCAVE